MPAMRLVTSLLYLIIITSLHANLLRHQMLPYENSHETSSLDQVNVRSHSRSSSEEGGFNEAAFNDCCLAALDPSVKTSVKQAIPCKCNHQQASKLLYNYGSGKTDLPIDVRMMLKALSRLPIDRSNPFRNLGDGRSERLFSTETLGCSSRQCQTLKGLLMYLKPQPDGDSRRLPHQTMDSIHRYLNFPRSAMNPELTGFYENSPAEPMTPETKKSYENKNGVWITRGRRSKLERLHKKLARLLQSGPNPIIYNGNEINKKDDEGKLWIVRG